MTSKRAKGSAFERWVEAWLIKNDPSCTVHRQTTCSKWLPLKKIFISTRNDILGCIDLIYVSPIGIRMIQATCHTGVGKKFADLRAVTWPWELFRDIISVELWVKRGPRRVTIWRVYRDHEVILGEIINGKFIEKEEP
jgi:hypothetical protein